MKFLLDENLSPLHARTLRALGHDALSVVELGLSGADDSVVRHAAIQAGRILVTLDGDFPNSASDCIPQPRRPSPPLSGPQFPALPR